MSSEVNPTQSSYDEVADEYTQRIGGELEHKPLERELLARFAKGISGEIADVGCGPGHITRYLHDQGADAFGIDLSSGMIEQAARKNPGIRFEQGDMRALNSDDSSLGGLVVLYSIIHIPRHDVTRVLREFLRVLKPGGQILIGFHKGQEILHQAEMWGKVVNLDFVFFEPDEMAGYLKTAGFEIVEVIERAPYPEVEYQSHRAYVWARKPGKAISD
jgi:ubiquinone/menaquinone biosynthesis C-methylase UbiE